MKGYIEERAMEIARYIIDNNTTVRQAAKHFGISKSTVHKDVTERLAAHPRRDGDKGEVSASACVKNLQIRTIF